MCQLKKTNKQTHNLKVENYVLFGGFTEDLSLGRSLSDGSEELLQRGERGPGFVGVLQQKPGSGNIRRELLIKEKQASQINEFSTFL